MPDDAVPEAIAALLSAHALGALDSDEAAEADRLIERSSACRALFEQALETAALLALAVDGIEPDPRLRARILDAVRSEQER